MIMRLLIAIALLAALAGDCLADYTLNDTLSFNMEQSINGHGYFSGYRYARLDGELGDDALEIRSRYHGSGSIDIEGTFDSMNSTGQSGVDVSFDPESTESRRSISMRESGDLSYSPEVLTVGRGFYVSSPIRYSSMIAEADLLKNRASGTSMSHVADYAHALSKDLELLVMAEALEEDPNTSMMNISEKISSGRVHIGALQLPANRSGPGLAAPLTEIDEYYIGDFQILKRLSVSVEEEEEEEEEDWLQCCAWNPHRLIDEIFSCTPCTQNIR